MELFAIFYLVCGIAAFLLPTDAPNRRGLQFIDMLLILWGPFALWIAWMNRRDNLRLREIRRQRALEMEEWRRSLRHDDEIL